MIDNAQPPPNTPGPEHERLGMFIGRWHTTGTVAATDSAPSLAIDSIDTYEWYPGRFFMVHHADSKVGEDTIQSIEIMGYDPERGCYFAPFFDSTGGSGAEEIRLDGRTWTWRGANVMGVKEHRCFATVSEDGNTIRARHEKSEDGERWQLWMDVTLSKQQG